MTTDTTAQSKSYHHGALREALLRAGEEELREKGPDGFSLRSTAKRAGVSHAAPAHHFKDVTALLHALAATGFDRLTASMQREQAACGDDGRERLVAAGIGYVRFALAHPHLFQLMFGARSAEDIPIDTLKAGERAFAVLLDCIADLRGRQDMATEAAWDDVGAAWSCVHGLTHLLIGNKMGWLPRDDDDAIARQVRALLERMAVGQQ